MTRVLLPVFVGIAVLLLGSILLPIAVREFLYPLKRTKDIDDEIENLYEWER